MQCEFDILKRAGDFRLDVRGDFRETVTGIFGESGAGKTTLLNCLSGLSMPERGEMRLNGQVIFSSRDRVNTPIQKRQIGYVFQDALLFPHMTAAANIHYGYNGRGDGEFVQRVIALFGLGGLLERYPGQLSGGERQRVALARSLVQRPSLLLMDEPISSLDLKSRRQIVMHLKEIPRQLGIPVIYVSHCVSEMIFLAKKVFIIHEGVSTAYGDPNETLLDPGIILKSEVSDIENMYEREVLDNECRPSFLAVRFMGQVLKMPNPLARVPSKVRFAIKSSDIMVAADHPGRLSARNVFAGKVVKMNAFNGMVLLHVEKEGDKCLSEITPEAFNELGLCEGQTVYLVVKARSIKIIGLGEGWA